MSVPVLVMGLGATELLIIFGVIVLLFGASKLPDLARGSGRALRIFKAETKGLVDEDSGDEGEQRPRGEIDSSSSSSGGEDTTGSGQHPSSG